MPVFRQNGSVTPGQISCSEMQSVLSLEDAIKLLVRSQVVYSDSAHSEVLSENYPRAMDQLPKSGH